MYNANTDRFYKKVGNYAVSRIKYEYTDTYLIKHFYFDNKICQVDIYSKTFELYNCGYENCRLTTAQLNYLEQFYKDKGYKLRYKGV